MTKPAAQGILGMTLSEVIAEADAEFAKKHPELKGQPLTRDPKQKAVRDEWNEIFMRRALQLVAKNRDAVEAGRFAGGA